MKEVVILAELGTGTVTQVLPIPGRAIKSVEEHSNILNAIKMKDIALAKKCMSEHLDSVQRSMTNKIADEYEKA